MRLSLHTDYALRALIHLAAKPDQATTAAEMAHAYRISKNHLVKVLQRLRDLGLVDTVRGRGGGVKLARDPQEIRLGAVVRATEDLGELVECFNLETNTCPLAQVCILQRRLDEALRAYLEVLDGYTIADVTTNRDALARILGRT